MTDTLENFIERQEATELLTYGTDRMLAAFRILYDSHVLISKGAALNSCETLKAASYKGVVSESRSALQRATEAINAKDSPGI